MGEVRSPRGGDTHLSPTLIGETKRDKAKLTTRPYTDPQPRGDAHDFLRRWRSHRRCRYVLAGLCQCRVFRVALCGTQCKCCVDTVTHRSPISVAFDAGGARGPQPLGRRPRPRGALCRGGRPGRTLSALFLSAQHNRKDCAHRWARSVSAIYAQDKSYLEPLALVLVGVFFFFFIEKILLLVLGKESTCQPTPNRGNKIP